MQKVLDAKVEFYNPASGALRYSLTTNLRRIELNETAADSSDDASFELAHDFANLANFVPGDECRVYVKRDTDAALTHIWTGVLDQVRSQREGSTFAEAPLRAQDYVYWTLAHTYITDSFTDTAAGAIVRTIVAAAAPTINTDDVEDTDTTVASISFAGESLLSAIRRLAVLANATFKGDKDKHLHFFERGTESSGLSVSGADVVRGSFQVEQSATDFGNVVTVYGGKRKTLEQNGPTTFSTWAAVTGLVRKTVRIFFSKAKVARVQLWTDTDTPSALTGPLTVRIQADNAAGSAPTDVDDADFDLASVSLPAADLTDGGWTNFDFPDHIVPPGNYVWLIIESDSNSQRVGVDGSSVPLWKSYFDLPVIVQKLDVQSVATYGRRELQPIFNNEVQTEEEAEELASRVLAEHASPLQTGSYEVLDSHADLESALVGRWKFDETTGTTAADSVSTNHGTASGGVSVGATGQIGTSFDFTRATSGMVALPNVAALQLQSFAWEAWVLCDDTSTGGIMSVDEAGGSYTIRLFHNTASGGGFEFDFRNSTGGLEVLNLRSNGITVGAWVHLVATFDAATGTGCLYRDGVLAQTATTVQTPAYPNPIRIGRVSGGNYHDGKIDQPSIYNRALTAAEIAWLYKEGLAARSSTQSLATVPVGETVSATFTADGIPAGTALVITQKRHIIDADEGTYRLYHDFATAARTIAVEDVLRSYHDRIRRLEDKDRAQNVLSLISSVGDLVAMDSSISHEVNATAYTDSKVGNTTGRAKVGTTHKVRP